MASATKEAAVVKVPKTFWRRVSTLCMAYVYASAPQVLELVYVVGEGEATALLRCFRVWRVLCRWRLVWCAEGVAEWILWIARACGD